MNEIYQKVIDKLDKEAEKENKPEIRAIEELLREVCKDSVAACEKVLAAGKDMKGAYNAMYEVAKRRKSGGCVCIAPDEAKRIILKYFDIGASDEAKSQTSANVSKVVDLFDLI